MSANILFIFEGEKTERQIVNNLQQNLFATNETVITSVYGAEIYQIYKDISEDNYLDTFSIIKERVQNVEALKDYKRDDFAEIYMFFDYDGHSRTADDDKLKELLAFFREETDKGKLYISYPMVEALKHINCFDSFKDLCVECKTKINYKNLVSGQCINKLQDFTNYDVAVWRQLIDTHLKKMNYIVFDSFDFPQDIILQETIFSKQLEKYISLQCPMVSVLSAFPIFIHDYFGNSKTKELISE